MKNLKKGQNKTVICLTEKGFNKVLYRIYKKPILVWQKGSALNYEADEKELTNRVNANILKDLAEFYGVEKVKSVHFDKDVTEKVHIVYQE
jgi:hypothetical protein